MSSFYNSENLTCIYLTRSIFDFGNRHFVPEKLNIVNGEEGQENVKKNHRDI